MSVLPSADFKRLSDQAAIVGIGTQLASVETTPEQTQSSLREKFALTPPMYGGSASGKTSSIFDVFSISIGIGFYKI